MMKMYDDTYVLSGFKSNCILDENRTDRILQEFNWNPIGKMDKEMTYVSSVEEKSYDDIFGSFDVNFPVC